MSLISTDLTQVSIIRYFASGHSVTVVDRPIWVVQDSIRLTVLVLKGPLTFCIHYGDQIIFRVADLISFNSATDFDNCCGCL